MTPAQAKKALEAAEARYWAEVDRIAAAVVKTHVKPFCELHGVEFRTGMGGWSFHGLHCEGDDDNAPPAWSEDSPEDLPPELYECLQLGTVSRANDLGSLAPGYMPSTYMPRGSY